MSELENKEPISGYKVNCEMCRGSGIVKIPYEHSCPTCGGKGYVIKPLTFTTNTSQDSEQETR